VGPPWARTPRNPLTRVVLTPGPLSLRNPLTRVVLTPGPLSLREVLTPRPPLPSGEGELQATPERPPQD